MIAPQLITPLAKKYLWWKTPEEVSAQPDLLIAQIMNIGTWDDVVMLEGSVPVEQLRRLLTQAEPGQFSDKSWQFWHLRLHLADIDHVPPPPRRQFE
jgi:hypothetical protein